MKQVNRTEKVVLDNTYTVEINGDDIIVFINDSVIRFNRNKPKTKKINCGDYPIYISCDKKSIRIAEPWGCCDDDYSIHEVFFKKKNNIPKKFVKSEFVKNYLDNVDWKYLTQCKKLSEDFIKNYKDKIDWTLVVNDLCS